VIRIKVNLLASDSLGVRSMATNIVTKECNILIDPSVALSPKRKRLPPSNKENTLMKTYIQHIKETATYADIIVISHYHYDHVSFDPSLYQNKMVYAKDITHHINASQKERGESLQHLVSDDCTLYFCDDTSHHFGKTKITFSPPVPHGPSNSRLGYVVMVTIDDGRKRVLFSSDVQGPVDSKATAFIIDQNPDLLILDGPPTYLLGWRFGKKNLDKAAENLNDIIRKTNADIIMDHHPCRDLNYKQKFPTPFEIYRETHGSDIMTFADYMGKENLFCEALRKTIREQEAQDQLSSNTK